MKNLQKQAKFDNIAEEQFYDFLNDFELTSMVGRVETQVPMKSGFINRRVDFVLTLTNGEILLIEVDGSTHLDRDIALRDRYKDWYSEQVGSNILRIKFSEFFENREIVANKIEAKIDLLSAI